MANTVALSARTTRQWMHGGSFVTTDPGRHPITLAPGAAAQASLGWTAMAPAGSIVGTILVAPYAGAVRQKSRRRPTPSTAERSL